MYANDIGVILFSSLQVQNAGPSPVENMRVRIHMIETHQKEYILYLLGANVSVPQSSKLISMYILVQPEKRRLIVFNPIRTGGENTPLQFFEHNSETTKDFFLKLCDFPENI